MYTMKKIIFSAAIILTAFFSSAQLKYGFLAGTSFGNQTTDRIDQVSNVNYQSTSHSDIGLSGGIIAEFSLMPHFSLRPQFNALQKNFSYSFAGERAHYYELDYFQLPVSFVYNYPVLYGKFYAGAGPVASMGISGKRFIDREKSYVEFDGETNTKGDGKVHYKRFDLGIIGNAGYQFDNGVLFDISYEYGLTNINPDEKISDVHSLGLSIKVGYMFGGSKIKEPARPEVGTEF